MVVLVDASASMRRPGLWDQAMRELDKILKRVEPTEEAGVLLFSRNSELLVSFEDWRSMEPVVRADQVLARLKEHKPGWGATHLDRAMFRALELFEEAAVGDKEGSLRRERQLFVISDLQEGSSIAGLRSMEWPDEVGLSLVPLKARGKGNAGLHVTSGQDRGEENEVRLLLVNSSDNGTERFVVRWTDRDGNPVGDAVEAYVPPGQNRIARIPAGDFGDGGQLMLLGDDITFDNQAFHAPQPVKERRVVVLSGKAERHLEEVFYLERAFSIEGLEPVKITSFTETTGDLSKEVEDASLLVILSGELLNPFGTKAVEGYLAKGRSALVVADPTGDNAWISRLVGEAGFKVVEEKTERSMLLGKLDFQHPLLSPFADPRFSNFSNIQFWKRGRLEGVSEDMKVVAAFDDESPSIVEVRKEKGGLLLLASGWHPDDSQLALSTKFVPMLYTLLDLSHPLRRMDRVVEVGDEVDLGIEKDVSSVSVTLPDGITVQHKVGEAFRGTDLPGLYSVAVGNELRTFAVNVPVSESRTAPMETDELEKNGIRIDAVGEEPKAEEPDEETARMLLKAQLENRQKLWRWAVAGAILLMLLETGLAGRASRVTAAEGAA